jgi:RNA polymerase sigma-70 factor (ECF subfamily)
MDQKTDQEIVKDVQNGNIKAFSAIVERYEPKLQRYARKFLFGYEDSADLVQEVFIKAFVNIQSFDSGRSFSPWIYRIAHNEFINEIKKRGREPMSIFDSDTILPHIIGKQTADEDLQKSETREIVEKCLEKIGPKYREPLVLYYFEELGYKEIAEIMRIPVSTIGIRIKRGKALLKEIFKKNFS